MTDQLDRTWRPGYVLHDASLPRQRPPGDEPGEEPGATLLLYRPSGWLILEADGELDLQCVGRLRALIAIAGSRLVLDLSRVTFMDASGLGVLAAAGQRARRLGGAVRLVGATRQVRRIVILTQLDRVLPMFDTMADAMTDGGAARLQMVRRPAGVLSPRIGA